jgi:hypothetical protein
MLSACINVAYYFDKRTGVHIPVLMSAAFLLCSFHPPTEAVLDHHDPDNLLATSSPIQYHFTGTCNQVAHHTSDFTREYTPQSLYNQDIDVDHIDWHHDP